MLHTLTLTNFRKVTSDTMTFTPGLNVIRGVNEASKSTRFEALAYAFNGARALREPLEKVVTWGQKESSLKVEVLFSVNAETYELRRSKSGAELRLQGDTKPLVTGQSAVTDFIEQLLGADADTQNRMMLSNQNALRGALSDGPSAAVSLIESLANFSLIDDLITLVNEKLPTGSTVGLVGRITGLKEQIEQPVQDDTAAQQIALDEAETLVATQQLTFEQARDHAKALQPAALEAQQAAAAASSAEQVAASAEKALERARADVASIVTPGEVSDAEIAALEKRVSDADSWSAAAAVHAKLLALKDGDEWDTPLQGLIDEDNKVRGEVSALQRQLSAAKVEKVRLEGLLIKETTCAFCSKDLKDVPEVVQRNSVLAPQIEAQQDIIDTAAEAIETKSNYLVQLGAVAARNNGRQNLYREAAPYVEFDNNFVPARWTWTGPDMSKAPDVQADRLKLTQLKKQKSDYQIATGRRLQADRALDQASIANSRSQIAAEEARRKAELLSDHLKVHSEAANAAAAAELELRPAQQAHQAAQHALQSAKDIAAERRRAREALKAQLLTAETELKETGVNNALLSKLRGARPQVADKLWKIVLTSVSRYFSDIRGEVSTVQREDNAFTVNGQSIGGLSGSTLDAMGLGIRVALTKTFLPNVDFMVLDEPAAACDPTRETKLLGMIASCGFEQVLLVTHSDLADSFAANIIQL